MRRLSVRLAAYLVTTGLLLWSGWFIVSLLIVPPLPTRMETNASVFQSLNFSSLSPVVRQQPGAAKSPDNQHDITEVPLHPLANFARADKIYGFVTSWPRLSFETALRHIDDLDVILPNWLYTSSDGRVAEHAYPDREAEMSARLINMSHRPTVLPILGGLDDPYDVEVMASLRRSILSAISDNEYDGICFDFTNMPARLVAARTDFLANIAATLRPMGKQTCVILDLTGNDWPLERIGVVADAVIVLPFSQLPLQGLAGPTAPQSRFQNVTLDQITRLDPQKTVFAFANISASWTGNDRSATGVPFAEAARLSGLHAVPIHFDSTSGTQVLQYLEPNGQRRQIFVNDAISAYNQLVLLGSRTLAGFAIWPLGGEDPGLWKLALSDRSGDLESLLADVPELFYVGTEGAGEFMTAIGSPQTAVRVLETNPQAGLITNARYLRLPQTYTLVKRGAANENLVSLTFDDGPQEPYTTDILDILRQKNVPATFFMVGENAMRLPDLVGRVVREGHTLGVHTFTHPNIERIGATRLRLEINATLELFAMLGGRNTIWFRAPYGEDSVPTTPEQAATIVAIGQQGYLTVGTNIDPMDWQETDPDVIVASVRKLAREQGGGVILLHDAGGSREATVAALPKIIDALRADGFRFVTLAELAGISASEATPERVVGSTLHSVNRILIKISFAVGGAIGNALPLIFVTAIFLGILRSILVVAFAVARTPHTCKSGLSPQPVTVLIPAFNEESGVLRTIAAALDSGYPALAVIVIDDGSDDGTADRVQNAYGENPRVTLLRQKNRGKAEALNYGVSCATTDIVVAIDADTLILPNAISRLVRHFDDPAIGAVAGNTKVGNRVNLLTRLQSIEYITSQNLDRRAFEVLNAILVVPGAIGAWRCSALRAAGGYSNQTLAEDADMTVEIIRRGYRVIYEEQAVALTEAPETLGQFMSQRLRWTLGIMQVGWKHYGAIFERSAIGFVAIPNILVFGITLPLIAPIADVVFTVGLLRLLRNVVQHPTIALTQFSLTFTLLYAAYLLSDFFLSAVAFALERKENPNQLVWVLFQRIFYRQLLYITVVRALSHAITGQLSAWHKLVRTGGVRITEGLPYDVNTLQPDAVNEPDSTG